MKRLRLPISTCVATIIAMLSITSFATAAPTEIGFAGRISLANSAEESDLEPLSSVEIKFRIMDGNTSLFEETHPGVDVVDGLVFAAIGSIDSATNPLDDSVFSTAKLEMEITVDGEVLSPRLELLSVPYATRSAWASNAEVAAKVGNLGPEDIALKNHNHDADYFPKGTVLSCSGTQKVRGFNAATGDVQCAADVDTDTSVGAAANGGLVRVGTRMSIAANGVNSSRVLNNSLTSADLAPNAVTASELSNDAVDSSKVLNNSLTSADLAPNSVARAEIATNAVTRAEISGAEVSLRRKAKGCDSPRTLTTDSSCQTIHCVPGIFFDCSGTCSNRISPQTCTNTTVAYGLSPSIPQ